MDIRGVEFDVVVIGAGSAGCAAAHSLAESGLRVCVVEAGPDYGPATNAEWPPELLDPRAGPGTHDWGFSTEERPDGPTVPEPRAKVVGGCSAHNQCAAVWGMPEDYDAWAVAENSGWGYRDLAPLLNKVERAVESGTSAVRGHTGVLPTRPYHDAELAAWQRAFLDSAVRAGFPRVEDIGTTAIDEGAAPFHANVLNGIRWNAAFAFLDPIRRRSNLTILSDTLVDRLVLDGPRAVAMTCRSNGRTREVSAARFVLCAGVYGSPAILLRSGIGPDGDLKALGIPTRIDLPGVGANLHDHPGTYLDYRLSGSGRRALENDVDGNTFYESQVMLRGRSQLCAQRFDLHLLPYQTLDEEEGWISAVLVYNMVPKSRGRVRLRGTDPELPPGIEPKYFTDAESRDLAVVIDGIRMARRLVAAGPLDSLVEAETAPGPEAVTDAALRAYVRDATTSYAHPVGTCKMGPASDPAAVVGSRGKVCGTDNVFVADASVIPTIPRANTNLTCMLVGLRVAGVLTSSVNA